jgi:hypothetical protein
VSQLPYKYGNEIDVDFLDLCKDNVHYLRNFKCGFNNIDKFIRNSALKDSETVTYFAIDKKLDVVIAILTISCSGILVDNKSFLKRYRYVVPAIDIRYFAINEKFQHIKYSQNEKELTLGHQIFLLYLSKIRDISKNICGATKVILYSVPTACNFYKRCKFKEFAEYMTKDENPYLKGCKPMFLSLN